MTQIHVSNTISCVAITDALVTWRATFGTIPNGTGYHIPGNFSVYSSRPKLLFILHVKQS